MEESEYLTIPQVVRGTRYPFTNGQMRQMLIMRHKNGLDKAVRKIGKRIYLNKLEFDKWIESHGR